MVSTSISLLRTYIKTVAQNSVIDSPISTDLIISGGGFNGAYGYGAVTYIKEMELQGKLKINRVSGSSIGSLLALIFIANSDVDMEPYYEELKRTFATNGNLNYMNTIISEIVNIIIPAQKTLESLNDKLYITMTDMHTGDHIHKHKYENIEDLIHCISSSCYIPILTDGGSRYKDRYVDGIVPYMFKDTNANSLYVNMIHSKIYNDILNTSTDNNPQYRIMLGAADAAALFNNQESSICSWVNKWGIIDYVKYRLIHVIMYLFCVITDYAYRITVPDMILNNIIYKGINNVIKILCHDICYNISTK